MQSIGRRMSAAVGMTTLESDEEEQDNSTRKSLSPSIMSSMGLSGDFQSAFSGKSDTYDEEYETESEEDDDDYLEEDLTGM